MTLQSIDEYGPSFQMKVISSLLTHKEFLQNINDVLSDEYFSNPAHKWVINEILKYYEKYHTTISMDILKVEMKKLENEVCTKGLPPSDGYIASDFEVGALE